MKKIVLVVIGLLFLSGSASAFLVNIETRDTLTGGKPLIFVDSHHACRVRYPHSP